MAPWYQIPVMGGRILIILFALMFAAACRPFPEYQQSPEAAVRAFIDGVRVIRETGREPSARGTGTKIKHRRYAELGEAGDVLAALVPDENVGMFLMTPLLMYDLSNVRIASVESRGAAGRVEADIEDPASAGHAARIVFNLRRKRGRWMIADVNGILEKYGPVGPGKRLPGKP
ncbi:MAG: hypothetical protein M5R36_08990 [Deltaproteobacteria bacterium]|nr:hypothetical protein [Deltaproteobacteria bacterium]